MHAKTQFQSSPDGAAGRPVAVPGKKLGQLLVERGWVDGRNVLRALQTQRASGCRLGTRLLEMDAVSEDHLLDALAEQSGAPAADIDRLRQIPEDVIGLISAQVARNCWAVPFACSEDTVDVAVLDARNSRHLDVLSMCTNRRVRAHVASEPRIYEALVRYYGVECPSRFLRVIDRLNRKHFLWKGESPEQESTAAVPTPPVETQVLVHENGQVEIGWQDMDATLGAALVTAPQVTPQVVASPRPAERSAPQRGPTLQEIHDKVSGEATVDEVGDLVLRFAAQSFSRTALFRIHKGNLKGWKLQGDSLAQTNFEAVEINLREPSILHELLRGVDSHVGPLAPMPAHRRMVQAWGGDWPGECVALPIRVRGRLTAVLYGDRGPLTSNDYGLEGLLELTELAGRAFEAGLLRKKKEQRTSSAPAWPEAYRL